MAAPPVPAVHLRSPGPRCRSGWRAAGCARRLREEMDARGQLSGNVLAKRAGIGQRSVARILLPDGHKDQQTPSLDVVDKLSNALGVPAWALLVEADAIEQRVIRPPMAAQ